jgi:hypothetical protein
VAVSGKQTLWNPRVGFGCRVGGQVRGFHDSGARRERQSPSKAASGPVEGRAFGGREGYYEFWFNFHGQEGPFVEEALSFLGTQPLLILNVHDKGPKPVRTFAFPNRMGYFFRWARKVLAESAPWEDREFEEAKASLQRRHSPRKLFRLLGA